MIHITLAQLNSNDDIHSNLKKVLELVDEAGTQDPKPDLIFFPENTLFFRMNVSEKMEGLALNSGFWNPLKEKAKLLSIPIHLTTALLDSDGKIYNGSVLIHSSGELEVVYRKIHLFDISLSGQKPIRESDAFQFGTKSVVFEIKGFKFGSSICYDVRFSELYSKYAQAEVDVILVPSAFLVKTGEAHWHILLRARAIESQCYVLAAAQAGTHVSTRMSEQRQTFGHTLAVGPWGQILQEKAEGVGLINVKLTKTEIQQVRTQIPMKAHRRL